MHIDIPFFPGNMRKNDALFMWGALQGHPWISTYTQDKIQVVHGPSCRKSIEIHTDTCASDRIDIQERRGGGGTVVLSPGMVVTIIVGIRPAHASAIDIFQIIHSGIIRILHDAGVRRIEQEGISDLAVDGKKILGSSLYLGNRPRLYYYQSSLMVESDISLIDRYLAHPPREPQYRAGRSHSDFCTTLKGLGYSTTAREISSLIRERLPGLLQ